MHEQFVEPLQEVYRRNHTQRMNEVAIDMLIHESKSVSGHRADIII